MTTILTISASSNSGWVKVFIDGNEVLKEPGSATVSLDAGLHYLTYFVQGLPGSTYHIAIDEPAEEWWEVKGVLKYNHTTGQHGITI